MEAGSEGVSINAEINEILTRYVLFLRHSEEHESMVIPQKIFSSLIGLVDEQKWIEMLNRFSVEMMPLIFMRNGNLMDLRYFMEHGFGKILIWTGMYSKFTHYVDSSGHLCLVFEHHYGLKWSRILAATFSNFLEKILHIPSHPEALPAGVVVRIRESE